MTERSRSLPVVTIALALFCLLLVYLALQVRAGNDPSLGAAKPSAAAQPRQVIVRRIIETRVVEDPPARTTSAGRRDLAPAPTSAAPRASAPAPAAPAAPAPAPAPVVSRAS
jgi:hypothetical protein